MPRLLPPNRPISWWTNPNTDTATTFTANIWPSDTFTNSWTGTDTITVVTTSGGTSTYPVRTREIPAFREDWEDIHRRQWALRAEERRAERIGYDYARWQHQNRRPGNVFADYQLRLAQAEAARAANRQLAMDLRTEAERARAIQEEADRLIREVAMRARQRDVNGNLLGPSAFSEAVNKRALKLLRSLLSEEDWQHFEKEKYLTVVGASGKVYRLRPYVSGNIEMLGPDGNVTERWCIHPYDPMPLADVLIAQLLHLRTNDNDLRKRANVTPIRPSPQRVRVAA